MLRKNSKGKQSTKYNFLPTRQAGHPSNTEITLFGGEDSPFARSWPPRQYGSSTETWRVWRGSSSILGNIRPISRLLGLSSPAPTTMNANQNEPDNSPGNTAEHGDEEAWSGDDDPSDIDGADASKGRPNHFICTPLSSRRELHMRCVPSRLVELTMRTGQMRSWTSSLWLVSEKQRDLRV
jgi:hypothetical protein